MKTRSRAAAALGTAALLTASLAAPAFASPGQEVTDLTALTADDLGAALVGDDTAISNVVYTGAPEAAGLASGMGEALGIDAGVVLSTGGADVVLGPNESSSTTRPFYGPGDADLDALVPESSTHDAAVLEFDFVATGTTVTFQYVFGSEEYLEYVDSSFNDVFAFYVNGENYATVDTAEGAIPVTINNINHLRNTHLFVDNEIVDGDAGATSPHDTELDGFTVELTFTAPVNVGETNRIKLAIADVSDSSYDSAVIIKAGSFKVNTPPVVADLEYTTGTGTPVDIAFDGSDADGDALTYEIVSGPDAAQGTLSAIEGAGTVFTPAEGFEGDATFTYVANDGVAVSEPATVTITVTSTPIPEPTQTPEPTATPEPTETPAPTQEPTPTQTLEPTETQQPAAPSTPSKPGLAQTGAADAALIAGIGAALALGGGLLLARRKARA